MLLKLAKLCDAMGVKVTLSSSTASSSCIGDCNHISYYYAVVSRTNSVTLELCVAMGVQVALTFGHTVTMDDIKIVPFIPSSVFFDNDEEAERTPPFPFM